MESTLIKKSKQQLERFKILAEELEVQLALGKLEARDAFKREQKNLSKYINQQKSEFKKSEEAHEVHRHELLLEFEKLESNLNVEVPTGKSSYDSYKKGLMATINKLEYLLFEYAGEVDDFMEGNLAKFKGLLDAYRIQLALSDSEHPKKTAERKEALAEMVSKIKTLLNDEEQDESKLDAFVEEVSTSFDHLKKAFSDLLG